MGYFSTIARAVVGKSAPLPYTDSSAASGVGFADIFRKDRAPSPGELVRENLNQAYACSTLNANLIASAPLRLYVTTKRGQSVPKMSQRGETREVAMADARRFSADPILKAKVSGVVRTEEVLNHPILDLLNNPNPDSEDGVGMSGFNLLDFTQLYQEVAGRAYWWLDTSGPAGRPAAIWILAAHQVQERMDQSSERVIDKYVFGGGSTRQEYDPSQIVPFRFPDLNNPYVGGVSPMRAVIDKIRLQRKVDARANAILDNGGMPSGLFIPKDSEIAPMTEGIARRVQLKLKQMLRFAGQGGIMVAEKDGQLVPLQWPTRDIADFKQLEASAKDICAGYQVPYYLVNPDGANQASIRSAQEYHGRFAGIPRCRRMEATLNNFLVSKFDDTGRLFLAFDSPVPEDRAEKREDYKILAQSSAIRRDEMRASLGLEPVGGPDGEAWVKVGREISQDAGIGVNPNKSFKDARDLWRRHAGELGGDE